MLWAAFIAIFLGLGGVVGILATPTRLSSRQRAVEAIQGYVAGAASSPVDERSAVSAISASLINMGDKAMEGRTSTPKTQRLLERADLPLRLGEWAVLRVVAIVLGLAGGILLMHGGPISTFVGAGLGVLVGVIGPAFFLKFAASRRSKKFERQLPDVLTLVASSLSTGFSLLRRLTLSPMNCWSCAVTAACTQAGRATSDSASSSQAISTAQAPSELGHMSSLRTG